MRIAVIYDGEAPRTPCADLAETVRDVCAVLGARPWPLARPLRLPPADLLFNLCEGLGGDPRHEAHVAGLLELSGIPFTGNGAFPLSIALDKSLARRILAARGLPVARGFAPDSPPSSLPPGMRFPAIVKPRRQDGSAGIDAGSVVSGLKALRARVRRLGPGEALVEEFLRGREFSVSLLGGRVLACSEMRFRVSPPIVSYRAKWVEDSPECRGTVPRVAAGVPPRLARMAVEAAGALGCTEHVRVDIRGGRVLEVNPNPDLSRGAGFARAAAARGWSYARLIRMLARRKIS